jgi:hypothetical protein
VDFGGLFLIKKYAGKSSLDKSLRRVKMLLQADHIITWA